MSNARLRKHADYQRVYKSSRKLFSASMTYFFSLRPDNGAGEYSAQSPYGPRIGLTAGRVMGKAVERNRIKRRMREAVRHHVAELPYNVDVVLHPRRSVLTVDFQKLSAEVSRVFAVIRKQLEDAKAQS
jgi:ribonuclease P protein component